MKQNKPVRKKFYLEFEKFVQKGKTFLNKMLFPEEIKCMFCGDDIPNFHEQPFCEDCAKTLSFNNGHRCEICDQPIESEATICDFCQKEKRNFAKIFCPFLYDGEIKRSILAFKDSNQRWRAKPFAQLIVKKIADLKIDIITYIPMTKSKLKQRSFNQSQLLAEEIGKLMGKPVLSCFEKVRDEKSQKTLTYSERQKAIVGMYRPKRVKLSKSQNVLIVDDVITTCATVGYCAGLISPKVNRVYVCGIAREYVKPKISQPRFKLTFPKQ